jgi:hypothetical protein
LARIGEVHEEVVVVTSNSNDRPVALDQQTCARLCGISVQAFARWGLKPVKREGRKVFYNWREVREMDLAKRPAGTRPGHHTGVPDALVALGDQIVAEADRALEANDIPALLRCVREMQRVARAAGVEL